MAMAREREREMEIQWCLILDHVYSIQQIWRFYLIGWKNKMMAIVRFRGFPLHPARFKGCVSAKTRQTISVTSFEILVGFVVTCVLKKIAAKLTLHRLRRICFARILALAMCNAPDP